MIKRFLSFLKRLMSVSSGTKNPKPSDLDYRITAMINTSQLEVLKDLAFESQFPGAVSDSSLLSNFLCVNEGEKQLVRKVQAALNRVRKYEMAIRENIKV